MANPFFSGRIPQELLNQIEKHVQDTGESKTNILIQALAVYLNFPIKLNSTSNSDLEKRVHNLEQQIVLLLNLDRDVSEIKQIILNQNQSDNNVVSTDNIESLNQLSGIKSADNNVIKSDNQKGSESNDKEWQPIGEMTIVEILKLPDLEIQNETKFRDKLRVLNSSKKKTTIVGSYQFEVIGKEPGAKGRIIYKIYK